MSQRRSCVFFVDDDQDVRDVVRRMLETAGMTAQTFSSAEACVERLSAERCDLVITDVRLPGMDGMTFVTGLRRSYPWLPTIVVTAYGRVSMAVEALKAGVCDFLEKPIERERLLSAVDAALGNKTASELCRPGAFTATEAQVLRMVLEGKTSREISQSLHRSIRTIESHRSHIMHKMHAHNLVELILRVDSLGQSSDRPHGSADPGPNANGPKSGN